MRRNQTVLLSLQLDFVFNILSAYDSYYELPNNIYILFYYFERFFEFKTERNINLTEETGLFSSTKRYFQLGKP